MSQAYQALIELPIAIKFLVIDSIKAWTVSELAVDTS